MAGARAFIPVPRSATSAAVGAHYELPVRGDPVDDALRPFVLLYSAETIGLPRVPFPSEVETFSESGYTPLPFLVSVVMAHRADGTTLVPSFPLLIALKMPGPLHHAHYHSPTWGQHAAQLSELLRSRSCEGGYNRLPELVNLGFHEFAQWMRSHLQGGADSGKLGQLK
ncbi:hypothetical protein N657DRAFT_688091 [Parathielavia appendiculata]|uniref:Uncharacterized protein n=1 Tax=Parathielavia appendiculata TaxID=2587402 RepID=A0AAN6U7J4_9PEZI|nr:hypothetical protein N657DRAFT_688091 [Parathielavia appendiculata]